MTTDSDTTGATVGGDIAPVLSGPAPTAGGHAGVPATSTVAGPAPSDGPVARAHDLPPADPPAGPTPPAPADTPGPAGRGPRPVLLVAAVALVLALAASVALGWELSRRAALDTAQAEALATARAYAVTVTSYDHRDLDRNFADVLDGATGEFKDQYAGASAALGQLINEARATAAGTVVDAGVRAAGTDEVEVLLFVDQTVSNALTATPRVDRSRVLMTMTRQGDRWLVSRLELV